ncbi:bifunctional DNA-formamidopyrimidine glycosylase/DNA-(apurinic or apyrimidinic site) lyase [Candidatus Daviesbacteria bacterium]|nr:bifunctional DNA-formamidopyrimidine glycosylase/DNA-(apurinic or apyrimidinic site) lyase [Candidatus Daviesbacteria bacterium]
MPELPEVEIIKQGLEKKIIGLKIQKIQVLSPKSFIGNPKLAMGQTVLKVWRRAKILGMDLDKVTLLFHMKMSGQLIWKGESGKGKGERFIGGHPTPDMVDKMPNPHTRVIFTFSDGSHLYFNDQRKFGWIKISDGPLQDLGPEPLEKGFTWQILKQNLLRHKSMPVKVAVMDQSVVAGVGNIYANEACFVAKIDPRRKVADLTDQEFKSLHRGVIRSLREGIKYGGSTRVHFVDPEGRKGYFLDYAKVYGKEGYPCQGCPSKVKKITIGGRGTYFCPDCQR